MKFSSRLCAPVDGELTATQIAQQRAIDELARRVAKIEQRLNQ
jgi:hypothetical protein